MKHLSAAIEAPTSRLIWLCEGLVGLHTPPLPQHKSMVNAAKAARKFAMAGEHGLALEALHTVRAFVEDDAPEKDSVHRRVEECRAQLVRRLT